jgi:hypothetical protein
VPQHSLFDDVPAHLLDAQLDASDEQPFFSSVPSYRHPEELPRLTAQCIAVLERLQQGRASNHELCAIALKYNARISDLRAAGYIIVCIDRNRKTGIAYYELRGRKA